MNDHEQWCARHWAPCPQLGANGTGAALEVFQLFLEEVLVPSGIKPSQHEQANAKLKETGKLCCRLGDERMYEIWGRWPPVHSGE